MRNYSFDQWLALGRAVKRARKKQGLGDMKRWAAEVGRSTKTLYGLEAGSKVSEDTIELIEAALEDWPQGRAYRILVGEDVTVADTGELVFHDTEDIEPPRDPNWSTMSSSQLITLVLGAADELSRRLGAGDTRASM